MRRSRSKKDAGEILAWESDGLTLRFEEGLFERERQRTFEAYAGKPNAFQTETPLSSLAGYLCQPAIWRHVTELLPGYHQESSSETPAPLDTALLSGLEKLIDAGSLRPLDAAISRIGTDQEQKEKEPFRLPAPSTRPQGLQAGAKVLAARAALALAPRVLEEGQWPMQLTREVCLVLLDRGHYTGQVIQQLLQDPDCGPLCYATIAALLEKAGHPASSAVARRGLGQLTPENFSKDMTVLLQGKSGLWLQEMIAAIASLTPSERDAVAAHLTPPLFQALFLQAHTIGRRAADEKLPLHEAAYRVSHDHLRDWLEAQTVR